MNRTRRATRLLATMVSLVLAVSAGAVLAPAQAAATGSISGVVTDRDGAPLEGVTVHFTHDDGTGWAWVPGPPVQTNALGRYSLTGLAPGTYRLNFSLSGYVPQYFPSGRHRPDDEVAGAVVIDGGPRSGVNMQLQHATSISGTVSSPSLVSGEVRVWVLAWDAEEKGWFFDSGIWVEEDGTYTVPGLAPGTYRVAVEHLTRPDLRYVYYPSAASSDEASDVVTTVAAPARGIDVTLVAGGTIAGTVSAQGDTDRSKVRATAFRKISDGAGGSRWIQSRVGYVAADGRYQIQGLHPGTYLVRFEDEAFRLFRQYYPAAEEESAARPVTVVGTSTVSGVDVSMLRGGTISGRVRVPSGVALSDVLVTQYQLEDGAWRPQVVEFVGTDGSYRFTGLSKGSYGVRFEDRYGTVLAQFHGDVASAEESKAIAIDGNDVTGIDADLSEGAAITGAVALPEGIAAEEIEVRVLTQRDGAWHRTATAGLEASGRYRVPKLHGGRYKVTFVHRRDLTRPAFNGGAEEVDAAVWITVPSGGTVSGVDATLALVHVEPPALPPVLPPVLPPEVVPVPPAPGLLTILRVKKPKVKGKAKVGKKLKVTKGTWNPRQVTVKFRWFTKKGKTKPVAVAKKKGAKKSLKLTKKFKGKKVRVRVTVSRPGYRSVVFTSKWSKKVA